MFQAITVKYFGPTNTRGSRWKAVAAAGSVTVSYDHSMNASDNARAAAVALANKYGWPNADKLQGGQDHAGNYVFVFPWPNQDVGDMLRNVRRVLDGSQPQDVGGAVAAIDHIISTIE